MSIGYRGRGKPSDRTAYLNWGGHGCDPELDQEVFVTLSKQVRLEKLAIYDIASTTNAVSFHIIDPGTGQPYPDQPPLIMDIARQRYPHLFDLNYVKPPEPVDVPAVPLATLKKFGLRAVLGESK